MIFLSSYCKCIRLFSNVTKKEYGQDTFFISLPYCSTSLDFKLHFGFPDCPILFDLDHWIMYINVNTLNLGLPAPQWNHYSGAAGHVQGAKIRWVTRSVCVLCIREANAFTHCVIVSLHSLAWFTHWYTLSFLLYFLLVPDCGSNPVGTGDITLQPGESINLASPNFPAPYASNLDMIWKITVLSCIIAYCIFAWNDLVVHCIRDWLSVCVYHIRMKWSV